MEMIREIALLDVAKISTGDLLAYAVFGVSLFLILFYFIEKNYGD